METATDPAPPNRWTTGARIFIGVAVLLGLAIRIGWNLIRNTSGSSGETQNIAFALATGRGFADAFAEGQGPTAHVMPVAPLIAALPYKLFGVGTTAAEFVLSVYALAVVFGAFLFLAVAARRSGFPSTARLAGFAFLAAVPTYALVEAVDFRVWEGGLGLCLAAALLTQILRYETRPVTRTRIWGVAALAAALFFTHPTLGLAGYLMLLLFAARRLRGGPLVEAAVAAILCLAVLVTPWAIRNYRAFGETILLRDNLGLELAVSNYPGNVDPADPHEERVRRLVEIQPFLHPEAYAKLLAAGGEPEYSRQLGREAKAWMAAHPGDTARIFIRHLREMLFPRVWMFQTARATPLPIARSIVACTITVLGLCGLWVRRRHPATAYWAILIGVVALAYMPFQVIPRYSWLIYPPLVYLAMAFLTSAFRRRA